MSSGIQLLDALGYLKQQQNDEINISKNFRYICNTLRKTNSSLGNAWDSIYAAYTNVNFVVDEILSSVYVQTKDFAGKTIENERKATETAEAFTEATSSSYDNIISVCNKYGISGVD